jgi:phosphoserine phosphatase
MLLVNHPEIQTKLREAIVASSSAVGDGLNDNEYLDAVVNEVRYQH